MGEQENPTEGISAVYLNKKEETCKSGEGAGFEIW